MSRLLEQRLREIADNGGGAILSGGKRGIEKECLRITPDGLISRTAHPAQLGSALANSFITTDYSEALLEFVTPPESSAWAAMQFLCDIHQFTYTAIGEELLWPFSMPCRLRTEEDIPVAQYGSSNVGRMKTIYRNGLGHRYGRYMQAIAGIHFNYSVPEAYWQLRAAGKSDPAELQAQKSDAYFALVRNVRRMDWLLLYLFGASPAVCRSFLAGVNGRLSELDSGTCYSEWATSLRMSDIGYQNANQSELVVSANSLAEYVRDLSAAIKRPSDAYVKLGVKKDGDYLQLNANQLQIENEFYSSVRPKRVARSGERPTAALLRGGVEYVELRSLDLCPFHPAGIGQPQQKFLEAFLIYCLLEDSPPIDSAEQRELQKNYRDVARQGREPGLALRRRGAEVRLQEWAKSIVTGMRPICEMLDHDGATGHVESLEIQLAAVEQPELTPSARLLAELRDQQASFADYGLDVASRYRDYFLQMGREFNVHADLLAEEAARSLQQQRDIEAADSMKFDDYLATYYA
jgi:glutamate--cysteine ligase